MNPSLDDGQRMPAMWRRQVDDQLEADETVSAWFLSDLDPELHYAEGIVVLTNRRLLSFTSAAANQAASSWRLDAVSALRAKDRWGLGTLELEGPAGPLATWRYTVGRAASAHRLAQRLDATLRGAADEDEAAEGLPEEVDAEPRSAGSLFRLLKFGRQRAGLMVLGFVLTLAVTVAGLIPPYLIMPLTRALTTLNETGAAGLRIVAWCLAGIGVAAVVAWLLTWAQGIVMAWASERISADLRNHTYAHLQRLSLEYFGGKRTGDLLARISTDTERICYFLSDNLVDFSTDVLMIVGTAIILWYLNPIVGAGGPVAVSDHRLAGLPGPQSHAARFSARRPGLGRDDQHSGRHDSRHPRGQGVCPGEARDRALPPRQRRIVAANDRVNTVWTFFWPMVALLNQVGLSDRVGRGQPG